MNVPPLPRGYARPMLPELMPCPFCGGEPALNNVDWMLGARRVYCGCTECRATAQDIHYRPGSDDGPRDEAMYAACCAWNTRAAQPATSDAAQG